MSTQANKPAIGFIGLGIMGAPMAGHVRKAGFPLRVHTRTRSRADAVLADGATWCDSPHDVAERCDVLLTIVTDTPDVEQVLFGDRGAAAGLRPGSVVVDLSTIAPDAARSFAARLVEQRVEFLDAPVTGGDVGARNGTLTVMVGGAAATLERVRPVLDAFAKTIVHVGPSGAGQALKACNQAMCALNMIGVCEALMLARESGIDLKAAIDALAGGAGGSWAWQNLGARVAAGDLKPAFMISLMQKDLRIVQDAAQRLGVPLPGVALAQQLFRAVEVSPDGDRLGTQAMILAYEKLMSAAAPRTH